jgi:hypothetical protein
MGKCYFNTGSLSRKFAYRYKQVISISALLSTDITYIKLFFYVDSSLLSPTVPIVELRESHQRLPDAKHEITPEALRSVAFRNLASHDAQIAQFRSLLDQFSFQMIPGLFRIPKTTAWEIYMHFEHAEHEDSLSKYGTTASRPPNSVLLPEEERRAIVWIGSFRRQGNCLSPREVRDFDVVLFEVRTGQEGFFSRDW